MAKRAREEGTTHKLLYFDFPGKAEAIRLALTHAGVAFEDHRFADRAEFQALKASGRLQFGQVPALEVTTAAGETTVLTQSAAILRYVAKLNDSANLYPADPLLAARVDVYLTTVFPLDALLFAWDHCLLDGWRDELPRFLGDALGLLRDQLLSATTPAELELVLRDAPRALRTCDVRDARRARLRRKAASPMSPTRLERSASTSNGGNS